MTSQTFTLTVASAAAPTWFTSLNHKQWGQPLNNSTAIAAGRHWLGASNVIDPNASGISASGGDHEDVMSAWTGMGADAVNREVFLMGNGGHNGYAGNEVYSCALGVATPQWTRRRNADYPLNPPYGPYSVVVNAQGNKTADHNTSIQVAAEGRWFHPGQCSTPYLGGADARQWWEFNRTTNQYVNLGNTHPQTFDSVCGAAFWDPLDRQIIVINVGVTSTQSIVYQSIDNMSSGTPTLSKNGYTFASDAASGGVDTTNRVLMLRWRDAVGYTCWSLASSTTKQGSPTTFQGSGTQPPRNLQYHWHAASGAWLTWSVLTNQLFKGVPTVSGGNYTGITWSVVSGVTGTLPTTVGNTQPSLMYNKVNYIADMGDGTAALLCLSGYGGANDFSVMRLTGTV